MIDSATTSDFMLPRIPGYGIGVLDGTNSMVAQEVQKILSQLQIMEKNEAVYLDLERRVKAEDVHRAPTPEMVETERFIHTSEGYLAAVQELKKWIEDSFNAGCQ